MLCPHCKIPHEASDFELQLLGITRTQAKAAHICKAMGCNQCGQKGYSGRTTISELMVVTDDIRSLIMQRKDGNTIKKQAVTNGMKTFRDHGIQKVLTGITTIEELTSNTQLDI
ncbi:Type II secretion system protein E [compost metagenome]